MASNLDIFAEGAASAANAASVANMSALSVRQLVKTFGGRGVTTRALDGVTMEVARGEFVAIMGPSGSGKTTLLNCASTIERATSGTISIGGRDVSAMRGRELARFRRDQLGFIFQDFNLLDTLTARDNISLALTIKGASPSQIKGKVDAVAAELGVLDVLNKYPSQMSGGQKQRVAAARAIVADPELILADEPTGALDSKSSRALLDALTMMNTQLGATIMMVTHDAFAASFASRVIFLRDGRIFNEVLRGNDSREDLFARIMDVVTYLAQAE
jgi:putative ABC transport system ATP-binding protein